MGTLALSGHLEMCGVEVLRLQEDGQSLRCLQGCYSHSLQDSAVQEFVGTLSSL